VVATTLDPDALRASVEAARAESQRGRPAVALTRYRSLRSLIERAGDDSAEVGAQRARVLLGLAAAEFEVSGDLDAAMSLLDDAEQVADQAGAKATLASIRGQRALLLLRNGRREAALAAFDRAGELISAAGRSDQISILLNRGVLHLDVGSLESARTDFEACLEIAAASGDLLLEWKARHNLGYADFLSGRIPRSLAAMEEAERLYGGEVHPIGLLDRARVLRAAGLTSDADRLLDRVSERLRSARLHQDLGETDLVRSECALVEGDPRRALKLARGAERLFVRRGNVHWQRKAQLMVLQCEQRIADEKPDTGRQVTLRRLGDRALRLAEACRSERRRDLARSAELVGLECLLRSGTAPDRESARTLPLVRATDPLEVRLQTRAVRALSAMSSGEPSRASREVRRGLHDLGSYTNQFGSLDLRTASAVHGLPLARIGLELAEQHGSAADFFAAVERGRAISSNLARVGPPRDRRTADLLTALRQTEEEMRGLQDDPDDARRLTRLRQRVAGLQRDIRARAWELEHTAVEGAGRRSAGVTTVRAAAQALGTQFVTYVVHRGRWTAVVASARRPRLVRLADAVLVDELVRRVRADLDALAMPFLPPPLAAAVRSSLDAGLRRLNDLLVAPLGVAGAPLVVSGSASLVLLPWSLLPSRRGLPVVVTPSATSWLGKVDGGRRADTRVVSVAGPGLRRAEDEARRVRSSWPGARLLVGDGATTAAVRDAMAAADVVHVAAHGTHQQDSPLFSSLRLTDGPLYAYELEVGDRPAPCVVLSACEAGLATVRPGDEGLGLTSVLLHLGSHSVVAGVARVRDDVAARVMEDVHRSMAAGTASPQALAEALAHEDGVAPFVTFGAAW